MTESRRPGVGQPPGHHHDTQLDRIEKALTRTEKSVGLQQKAWERNETRIIEALERLERLQTAMASLDQQLIDIKTNLDAGTTKLGNDLDILIAAFATAGNVTPAQQALLDGVGGVASTLKSLDDKTIAAVVTEPPVDPNNPTARRRP